MHIRSYLLGDEVRQVEIYNAAAGGLPGFKPATAAEVARRYHGSDSDPDSRHYLVSEGRVVGYIGFNLGGRISYPWCEPAAESGREPLLDAALTAMKGRGHNEAWAAYRADWEPVRSFLVERGFFPVREMVNFVADLGQLPAIVDEQAGSISPLPRERVHQLRELGRGVFQVDEPEALSAFYWDNPFLSNESLFALTSLDGGRLVGVGLAVIDPSFADPTKIDPSMPCFRLGAMGTERERHKRVNGLFCAVFTEEAAGEALLAEAARRFRMAGLRHAAAQAPSDQPARLAFLDRFFQRQGSFPVLRFPLVDIPSIAQVYS